VSDCRILLVLAADRCYRWRGTLRPSVPYEPLTLGILAALVPPGLATSVVTVDEGAMPPVAPGPGYDVVGISCVASAAPRAYELADAFRALGSFVVLGGAHPTADPDGAAAHADTVVRGPAERSWPDLLTRLASGGPVPARYEIDAPGELSAPAPIRRSWRGRYLPVPTVFASRGCTNTCSFCTVSAHCSHRACSRPVGEVVEEVRALGSRRVVFLDPNIAADRGYALGLFEGLAELGVAWTGAATVDLAHDDALLASARASGCEGLLIGFESVSPESIAGIRKGRNDPSRYLDAVRRLHDEGISVLGCFVFGLDGDDAGVFDRTLEFIERARIDVPRFSVATPLPGSAMHASLRAEGRLVTDDLRRYDTFEPVFEPLHMTVDQLARGFRATAGRAYSWSASVARGRGVLSDRVLGLAVNGVFRRYYRASLSTR